RPRTGGSEVLRVNRRGSSREAAQEYSPRREPGVQSGDVASPIGGEKRCEAAPGVVDSERFFHPSGAQSPPAAYPRLMPWAIFLRRCAALGESLAIQIPGTGLLCGSDRSTVCPELADR